MDQVIRTGCCATRCALNRFLLLHTFRSLIPRQEDSSHSLVLHLATSVRSFSKPKNVGLDMIIKLLHVWFQPSFHIVHFSYCVSATVV